MIIETERLIIRKFKDTDYEDLYEFLKQLENDEFYAIELKTTGKVIGNIYCGKRECEAREAFFRKKIYTSIGMRTAIQSGRIHIFMLA